MPKGTIRVFFPLGLFISLMHLCLGYFSFQHLRLGLFLSLRLFFPSAGLFSPYCKIRVVVWFHSILSLLLKDEKLFLIGYFVPC